MKLHNIQLSIARNWKQLHEIESYCTKLQVTRKYQLRGYILGVLTYTTAWDRIWGGDGTLTMWFQN